MKYIQLENNLQLNNNISPLSPTYKGRNVLALELLSHKMDSEKTYLCLKEKIKSKTNTQEDIFLAGYCLFNLGLIEDTNGNYKKAINYYRKSAVFNNYKALINIVFHFNRIKKTRKNKKYVDTLLSFYIKKLNNIFINYKHTIKIKYIEKVKDILDSFKHLL